MMYGNDNPGKLTFATLNVNGASTHEKQKDIFDFLRRKNLDLIFLQETHWKSESENIIRSIWGYNCFVSGNSNQRKGVAILFKNSFTYKLHKVIKDEENGSFLILDITIFDERYTLANVYGPSERDDPDFFSNLFLSIEEIGNGQVITAGDWNVILNPKIDARNYVSYNNRPRSRKIITELMDIFDIVDIYREVYPEKKAYSWRQFNSIKQSRLDYFLISDCLKTKVIDVNISPGYRSDHSLVTVSLKNIHILDKPKGYWKFNNSLLYDKKYVEIVKKVIIEIKKQYALPIYNFENIDSVLNSDIQFSINDQLFFEVLLLEIRGKTISYSSHKKRNEEKQEKDLFHEINRLEKSDNLNQNEMLELEQKKLTLQGLREIKIRGMIVRSRLQWLEHGEKPSRYFCSLEKRHFNSKRMCFLRRENGDTIFDQNDIIKETKEFYENLYKKRTTQNVNLNNLVSNPITLNNNEKESLEGEITFQEAHQALKYMNNNRSPGNSGYTVEFYKFFFTDIGHFLIRSINQGFVIGKLSITQRQGVITCLPKEGKDTQLLSNWRPISLLNVSYKIASSCITNRIKQVLDKLINKNQKAFLPNRQISENLQLMYDILTYTEYTDMSGLLLLVDFQKAFDCISWDFIDQVLHFFNFGRELRTWVKLFYTDIMSCVAVNNKYSEYFSINRGVRQGDPLSPYLFLLCAEILACTLREDNRIKGLIIENTEAFLSQFADDTAIFLDGSRESFEACIRSLTYFAEISGLCINYDKTVVIWLGNKKNCNERYMRDRNFLWDPGGPNNVKFKYLGLFFSTNTENIRKFNYENKIEDIEKLLRIWSKRSLTPYGKITVLKTLAISKLTYLFINLPDPDRNFLQQLEKMFFKFLWDGKPNKINKNCMYLGKQSGGFDMINVQNYLSCLKIGWFKKILCNEELVSFVYDMYPILEGMKMFGSVYFDKILNEIPNRLWHDLVKHVAELVTKKEPENFNDFACECIFYNYNITVDNQPILYKSWIRNNVKQIHNLLNDDGSFMDYNMFITTYPNIRTNFLQFNGVLNAIRKYLRKTNCTPNEKNDLEEPVGWRILRGSKQVIKDAFKPTEVANPSKTKWNNAYPALNWKKIYLKCNKTSPDVKLRWFQMRLLYRILPTNRLLYIKRIKDNSVCNFCNNGEQTTVHLFWECTIVKSFWDELTENFISKLPHAQTLRLSDELIIFGTKENVYTDIPMDLLILTAKYFIYINKMSDSIPNVDTFLKLFKERYKLELYYSHTNNKSQQFMANWAPYQSLVEEI